MSDTDVFGSKGKLRWYHYIIHLGYYVPYWIKFFFGEPFKEPKKDLNILDMSRHCSTLRQRKRILTSVVN